MAVYTQADLTGLEPCFDTFVGIDSDGCVFDTMEIKQKRFFHGNIVRFWQLEAVEQQVRRAAEFVNLYSRTRGSNRFVALLRVFELLHDWPEVVRTGVELPPLEPLERYVNSGLPLGNPSLEREARRTDDPELERVLDWSLTINAQIAADMPPIPPFPSVLSALEMIQQHSDTIVVSQTPEEALVNEWRQHGIDGYVRVIAGQELGTKAEHLRLATRERYEPTRVLVIGDALGDLRAAREVGALFYPINPGREEESWQRLVAAGYERFLDGTFAGEYQRLLISGFEELLPDTPPWKSR